jgi:AcrR family transcriptional regulator
MPKRPAKKRGRTTAKQAPTLPRSKRSTTNADTRERILQAAILEFIDKGFVGGRLETICETARANIRMIYHYFGNKAGLYVAVLEAVLGGLRQEELKLDVDHLKPLEALMQLFDFNYDHFAAHPELISLLSGENLLKARFLKQSRKIPSISSPVLELIRRLVERGEKDGTLRKGIDPLQLYVAITALSYFHRSNGHTLSVIFQTDLYRPRWLAGHKAMAREMLHLYVTKKQ